jgi:hypothetical protein
MIVALTCMFVLTYVIFVVSAVFVTCCYVGLLFVIWLDDFIALRTAARMHLASLTSCDDHCWAGDGICPHCDERDMPPLLPTDPEYEQHIDDVISQQDKGTRKK